MSRRQLQPMHGQGFWGDVGKALKFTKSNKLVSRGLSTAAPFAGQYSVPVAAAAQVAGLLGWGRAPRRRRAPARRKAPAKRKARRRK